MFPVILPAHETILYSNIIQDLAKVKTPPAF